MSAKKLRKTKQKSDNLWSILIPVLVGLLVVGFIVWAVLANEKGQQTVSAASPTLSVPIVTSEPLPTTEIPNPNVQRISVKDAKTQLDKGKAVLYDVRTKDSYDQSHAVGAISMPEADVNSRLSEFPKDKLIILVCT